MITPSVSTLQHGTSVHHANNLIARKSVTPDDAGCQKYISHRLNKLGFYCQHFIVQGVSNLIAKWGHGPLHTAFSGHTDVVPPGPLSAWHSDPFSPFHHNSVLYGRGAADMKTGIAAMLAATERAIDKLDATSHTLWWLITSDEEGEAEFGTRWIKQYLDNEGVRLDRCLIGEPTASQSTGDTIKVGRRGALSGTIEVIGKQGHVAYPQSCVNAIHKAARLCQELTSLNWEPGTVDFPGTSLQITHMDTGTFTDNMIPGKARIEFNVRYSSPHTKNSISDLLETLIYQCAPDSKVSWSRACDAFLSRPRQQRCFIRTCEQAIVSNTGRYPVLSTSGGTSDGRFLAGPHTQIVELGVPNSTIHQVNESVHLSDLLTLEDIYTDILMGL